VQVVAAVDIWPLAQKTYSDNFAGVKFYRCKCENLSATKVLQEVGPVQMLIASPECTSHSLAKGSAERSEFSRETAFQVIKFARVMKPRWIVVENVIHMRFWDRYVEWLGKLSREYNVREQVLNSSDFGVPQSRKRMFVICDRETMPPEIVPLQTVQPLTAENIIDMNGTYRYSVLRTSRRAEATLQRAERAIDAVGYKTPFLLVYYGTDGAGGWQTLDVPLRTVTTLDRFAYVRPTGNGQHEMRMLQVPELKQAMGFPESYRLEHGVRRDKIKLLGNAVCPPVMKAIIEAITTSKNADEQVTDREKVNA
jgi:DNA (cytosine-5)-methyltransferase 1